MLWSCPPPTQVSVHVDGAQPEGSPGSPPRAVAGGVVGNAAPAVAFEGDVQGKTPLTLPGLIPSPGSSGGRDGARVKVCLTRLQLKAKEQACQANREFRLQIRKLELEAETMVRLRQLELEAQKLWKGVEPALVGTSATSPS